MWRWPIACKVQRMDVLDAIRRCGGVMDHTTAVRLTTRKRLRRALAAGKVVKIGHGRYALPTAHEGLVAAHRVRGTISHRSAAAWWGWELKIQPPRPEVTVPKHRQCDRSGVDLHWADLPADDLREGVVTARQRNLADCLRIQPVEESLDLADSALRAEDVTPQQLAALARSARGPGSARIRRVARWADGRAANPFESVLRALAIEVGLAMRPQVLIRVRGGEVRPDLVDEDRRLVVEADSFEWHGKRAALRRDCRRYNAIVAAGWILLRFSWEDVMHEPDYVRSVLGEVVGPRGRTQRRPKTARAA